MISLSVSLMNELFLLDNVEIEHSSTNGKKLSISWKVVVPSEIRKRLW